MKNNEEWISFNEFKNTVETKNKDIQVNWVSASYTPVRCLCRNHGKEFTTTVQSLLKGKGCPYCNSL